MGTILNNHVKFWRFCACRQNVHNILMLSHMNDHLYFTSQVTDVIQIGIIYDTKTIIKFEIGL